MEKLTLGNLVEKGDVLCESCQESVNNHDSLFFDGFELYHTKCWENSLTKQDRES